MGGGGTGLGGGGRGTEAHRLCPAAPPGPSAASPSASERRRTAASFGTSPPMPSLSRDEVGDRQERNMKLETYGNITYDIAYNIDSVSCRIFRYVYNMFYYFFQVISFPRGHLKVKYQTC